MAFKKKFTTITVFIFKTSGYNVKCDGLCPRSNISLKENLLFSLLNPFCLWGQSLFTASQTFSPTRNFLLFTCPSPSPCLKLGSDGSKQSFVTTKKIIMLSPYTQSIQPRWQVKIELPCSYTEDRMVIITEIISHKGFRQCWI